MKFKNGGLIGILFVIGMLISFVQDIDLLAPETVAFLFYGAILIFGLIRSKKPHRIPQSMSIEEINSLDPFVFEAFVSEYLVACGYAKRAKKTQDSHDWGADVRGVTVGGNSFVCQVKHSRMGRSQGKRAIEEVLTAQRYYGAKEMLAVTNTYFTKQARELSHMTGVKLIEGKDIKRGRT